jgi:hypothetical protein
MPRHVSAELLLFAAVAGLHGQTVTATSHLLLTLPASEAVFLVRVSAAADRPLSEIVDALAPAGVQVRDLAARALSRSVADGEPGLVQNLLFRVLRPTARYAEIETSLRGLASPPGSGFELTFNAYSRPSQTDIDNTRASWLPVLFREAKAQAEIMLIEAGFRPGEIVELAESVFPGSRVQLSLTLRMARMGLPAAGTPVVSTVVTPPASPYRIDSPRLMASYSVRSPQTRPQLLELLAPAGVAETHLTGMEVESDTSGRISEREPGPVTFTYRFTVPVSESDAAARLRRLPLLGGSGALVEYPVTPAAGDPVTLVAAARGRAALLAGLVGSRVGDGLGSAEEMRPELLTIPTRVLRSGDFSFQVPSGGPDLPIAFRTLSDPLTTPWFRYRFAVINENQ